MAAVGHWDKGMRANPGSRSPLGKDPPNVFHYLKLISAIITWTIAVTAIVTDPDPRGIDAAIFVATIACVPTFWLMIDHAAARVSRNLTQVVLAERKRTEDLVLTVATELARSEGSDVVHLPTQRRM